MQTIYSTQLQNRKL